MLNKLKDKWKVNGIQLLLILCTFAVGGSMCGYLGRSILEWMELGRGVLWFVLYLPLITILWPFCVLIVSIPLGQFPFFKNYLARIARRMRIIR